MTEMFSLEDSPLANIEQEVEWYGEEPETESSEFTMSYLREQFKILSEAKRIICSYRSSENISLKALSAAKASTCSEMVLSFQPPTLGEFFKWNTPVNGASYLLKSLFIWNTF